MNTTLTRGAVALAIGATVALVAGCAPGAVEDDNASAAPVETFDPVDYAGETLTYMYLSLIHI